MSSAFEIFPAIDLRDGKVVRLYQGNPNKQTVYSDDPTSFAKRWLDSGATWLHIINLSAAFGEEDTPNLRALEKITRLDAFVEYGGGIRTFEQIERLLNIGAQRVFLGTVAIQNPEMVKEAVTAFGASMIACDIAGKDGTVMIKGWQEAAELTILEAGKGLRAAGVHHCVLTDVARDGSGNGVNIPSAKKLQDETGLSVVASGGVHSYDEIIAAREAELAGIIIGKALYDGVLDLRKCFEL